MTTAHIGGYWGHLRARHEAGALSLFLRTFLPFLAALLIVGATALAWRMRALDRELDSVIVAFLELAGERLQQDMLTPIEDLNFLARELGGMDASEAGATTALRHLGLARSRYANIRLLNAAGIELARTGSAGGMPQGVPTDWSHSNLFSELSPMPNDGLYVSHFELRTERGKIVEPIEPILRFAMPFADAVGRRAGFIVIELNAQETLDALKIANPNGFVELLTADGYWVKAGDPQLEWGGVLREREHQLFSIRNARAWAPMTTSPQGKVRTENGGFWYRKVEPPRPSVASPHWMLVLRVPEDRLRARALGVAMALAALGLVAALTAAPFFWWLALRTHAGPKTQAASSS